MLGKTLLLLVLSPIGAIAQESPLLYEEKLNQAAMAVSRLNKPTTAAYRLDGSSFRIRQVNVDSLGRNIVKDAANEPSFVIDPTNPLRMAIGWRQFDTIASDFRQAGVAFSNDGGETWINQPPIEQGVFRSDPVLDADRFGNFYYNSLTSDFIGFNCSVFKSDSGANNWQNGVYAYGGDKQWMAIDRTGAAESDGNIYACWKSGLSSCVGGLTRSLNKGISYEPCELLPENPERGTLVVSPDGELYLCGANSRGIVVLKSNAPFAADFKWDQVKTLNFGGQIALYGGPNPGGLLGQVWIDVDASKGIHQGNVYVLATINKGNDPADLFLARSTNGGLTWEAVVRINDDESGNWQWFGSLSVAPTGRIDATWFDNRENPGSYDSRLYYSYSTDGGLTWSSNEALTEAFDPHVGWPQQSKLGDYNHQRSDANGVHLSWSATFNGEQDIYYSYIQPNLMAGNLDFDIDTRTVSVIPNPFTHSASFYFDLENGGNVTLEIFDARGLPIELIRAGELTAGKQHLEWQKEGDQGLYFYTLRCDGKVLGRGKMVRMK